MREVTREQYLTVRKRIREGLAGLGARIAQQKTLTRRARRRCETVAQGVTWGLSMPSAQREHERLARLVRALHQALGQIQEVRRLSRRPLPGLVQVEELRLGQAKIDQLVLNGFLPAEMRAPAGYYFLRTVAAGQEGVPAGTVYAALMTQGCTIQQYEQIEGLMLRSGACTKRGDLLFPGRLGGA